MPLDQATGHLITTLLIVTSVRMSLNRQPSSITVEPADKASVITVHHTSPAFRHAAGIVQFVCVTTAIRN